MTRRMVAAATAVLALGAAGCWNGAERAPGAPYTDITATSSETYARRSSYDVIAQERAGDRLTLSINVKELGNAKRIAEQAVNERRGDAAQVVVQIFDAQSRPPEEAYGQMQWTAGQGF